MSKPTRKLNFGGAAGKQDHLNKLAALFGPGAGPGGPRPGARPSGLLVPPGSKPGPKQELPDKPAQMHHAQSTRAVVAKSKRKRPARKQKFRQASSPQTGAQAATNSKPALTVASKDGKKAKKVKAKEAKPSRSKSPAAKAKKTPPPVKKSEKKLPPPIPVQSPAHKRNESDPWKEPPRRKQKTDKELQEELKAKAEAELKRQLEALPTITTQSVVGVILQLKEDLDRLIVSEKELRKQSMELQGELNTLKSVVAEKTKHPETTHISSDTLWKTRQSSITPNQLALDSSQGDGKTLQKVLKAGWMYKQGSLVANWKRRFFILYESHIDYFENIRDEKPKGTIKLDTCTVSAFGERPGVPRPCMQLVMAQRTWHFYADGKAENDAWYAAIENRILTLGYIRRCMMAKKPPNRALVDYLNAFQHGASARVLAIRKKDIALDTISVVSQMLLSTSACVPVHMLSLTHTCLDQVRLATLADAIKASPTVKTVNLSRNEFTLGTLTILLDALSASECQVTSLVLDQCGLTDEMGRACLSRLARCSVASISMQHNGLTSEVLADILPELTDPDKPPLNLVSLNLNANKLGDKGAAYISALLQTTSSLKSLHLSENNIRNEGAKALAKALSSQHRHLLHLDLTKNEIGDDGGRALAHMAQTNITLERLLFDSCSLSAQEMAVLQLLNAYRPGQPTQA